MKFVKLIQDEPYPFAQVKPISEEGTFEGQDQNIDAEVGELIGSFRKNAVNFLELLDISVPTVAKLKVSSLKNTNAASYFLSFRPKAHYSSRVFLTAS